MDSREAIRSQYLSSLEMMKQAVETCPEEMWANGEDKDHFWQIAYHALFYTHLYLQKTVADFIAWPKHLDGAERQDTPLEKIGRVYTKAEILEYLGLCQDQVVRQTSMLDLEAPSGFEWLPFGKLELQIYNIRHLQQHVGEMFERLGTRASARLNWVAKQ